MSSEFFFCNAKECQRSTLLIYQLVMSLIINKLIMEEISNKESEVEKHSTNLLQQHPHPKMNFQTLADLKSSTKENIPASLELQARQASKATPELVLTPANELVYQILRHQTYSFRVLTQKYRDAALELVSREFADQEPLSRAFCSQFPQQKPKMFNLWKKAWDLHIDVSINDGLGVIIIDESDNHKLVGISLATKMSSLPQDLQEKLLKDFTVFPFNVAFQTKLLNLVDDKNKKKLAENSLVMDILAVALDKSHMGKKLLPQLIQSNQILARKGGCKYSYVFASNFKTQIALKKIEYQLIVSYPSTQFEFRGIKPYALIEELHRNPTLWLKELCQ